MKLDVLKKIIKQAVREAIQEEMKDILMEALNRPSSSTRMVSETKQSQPVQSIDVRSQYASMMDGFGRGKTEMSFDSSHAMGFGQQQAYRPPASVNTTGEGSSLPQGEVSLDQIMGLMSK